MSKLTSRQREILEFIVSQTETRGFPPSVREIGEAVGLASSSSVHAHLATLQRLGYIKRDPVKPRALEIHFDRESGSTTERRSPRYVPLVGEIAAGQPLLASEHIEEAYPIPSDWIGTNGTVFMLEVKGDSMVNAGILDKDYVVVRAQQTADEGDIVAALIDGEAATVKRFHKEGEAVILLPENDRLDPMVFNEGVEILGKVVTVIRRL